jgi:hypothetical protein
MGAQFGKGKRPIVGYFYPCHGRIANKMAQREGIGQIFGRDDNEQRSNVVLKPETMMMQNINRNLIHEDKCVY